MLAANRVIKKEENHDCKARYIKSYYYKNEEC